MSAFADHDAYIAAASQELRPLLRHLRKRLAEVLPDLTETIRYDMPGFASGGVVVVGYGAFSRQCGLYVAKPAIAEWAHALRAAGLKPSKTGVTFTPKKPIPDDLIDALARTSRTALRA